MTVLCLIGRPTPNTGRFRQKEAVSISVTSRTARGRSFPLFAAVLVLTAALFIVVIGSVQTTAGVRAGLEGGAALLAMIVGLVALARYGNRRDLPYLFVGLGFVGVAFFDAANAITSSPHFVATDGRLVGATEWGWLLGRMYLATLLVLGWAALHRQQASVDRTRETLISVASGLVVLAGLWGILSGPPAVPILQDGPVVRPFELVPGALFLTAAVGYARRGVQRNEVFLVWLVFPLALLAATQFFLSLADAPSSALYSAALGAKLAAYALTLVGVIAGFTNLLQVTEASKSELAQMNARLTRSIEKEFRAERALAEQKHQLEIVLDSVGEGIVFIARGGEAFRANRAVHAMLGDLVPNVSSEHYLSDARVFHSDRVTPIPTEELAATRALNGEAVRDVLKWFVTEQRPEGFYARVSATPVRHEDGSVAGAVLVLRECTDEQFALEALRDREAKLDALVKTATDAIVSISEDSIVTEFNPAAETLFGWSEDEIVGQSVTRLMPAEHRDAHLKGVQRFLETGEGPIIGRAIELTAIQKDGKRVPIEISVSPWQAGDEMGFTAIIRNITARKEAEQRFLESEARYRVLAENATDLITETEADGTIRYASPAALSITGRTADMLVGRRMQDFLEADDEALFARMLRRVAQTDQTQTNILRLRRPDGDLVHLEVILRWIPPTDDEEDARLLGTYRNVTDKVRDREALARSNEELQEFAFIASHDLKEPIRKIIAFGDRIAADHSDALGTRGVDYLSRMRGAAERMRTLLDDLLAYSRVTTKAHPFEPVDLGALVEDVLEDLGEQIRDTGGKVTISRLPHLEGDPTQMRQLFQNLISNSLKYHQENVPPRVHIKGRDRDHVHEFTVEDNGIGFDMRYAERIFRPFQRLHGRAEYPGSGMGLAIVRKIVERHGGRIDVSSEIGKGSRFTIILPMHRPEEEETISIVEAPHA